MSSDLKTYILNSERTIEELIDKTYKKLVETGVTLGNKLQDIDIELTNLEGFSNKQALGSCNRWAISLAVFLFMVMIVGIILSTCYEQQKDGKKVFNHEKASKILIGISVPFIVLTGVYWWMSSNNIILRK
jgi:hypothetical protein